VLRRPDRSRGCRGARGLGGHRRARLADRPPLAEQPAQGGGRRMTPERWRRINALFDAALRLAPADREPWLREACGGDEDLRAEVVRLLAGDERAARDGFLTPPGEARLPANVTRSWAPRSAARSPEKPGPATPA